MHLTKTSITIPDDLLKEARGMSRNLSSLVTEALGEYIRRRKAQKALESFGAWQNSEENGVDMVNRLRSEGGRDNAGRAD